MLATHQRQLIKNLVINIMYRRSHKLLYLTHVVRWRMYSAPIQVEKHSQVKMVQSTLHGTARAVHGPAWSPLGATLFTRGHVCDASETLDRRVCTFTV